MSFGSIAKELPNGNFVVVDPDSPISGVGVVYLYSSSFAVISMLTGGSANNHVGGVVTSANSLIGTTAGDNIGNIGVTAMSNVNYVVARSSWNNGATAGVGAATISATRSSQPHA